MPSRSAEDLIPWLKTVWELSSKKWNADTTHPEVFLTCTYRSKEEQEVLYTKGRTAGGSKVTNSRGGQSLHNYRPAFAFDVAFRDSQNHDKIFWEVKNFRDFAQIVKGYGAEWGGDWKSIKDNPHFQVPNFSWKLAMAGKQPTNLPAIN